MVPPLVQEDGPKLAGKDGGDHRALPWSIGGFAIQDPRMEIG